MAHSTLAEQLIGYRSEYQQLSEIFVLDDGVNDEAERAQLADIARIILQLERQLADQEPAAVGSPPRDAALTLGNGAQAADPQADRLAKGPVEPAREQPDINITINQCPQNCPPEPSPRPQPRPRPRQRPPLSEDDICWEGEDDPSRRPVFECERTNRYNILLMRRPLAAGTQRADGPYAGPSELIGRVEWVWHVGREPSGAIRMAASPSHSVPLQPRGVELRVNETADGEGICDTTERPGGHVMRLLLSATASQSATNVTLRGADEGPSSTDTEVGQDGTEQRRRGRVGGTVGGSSSQEGGLSLDVEAAEVEARRRREMNGRIEGEYERESITRESVTETREHRSGRRDESQTREQSEVGARITYRREIRIPGGADGPASRDRGVMYFAPQDGATPQPYAVWFHHPNNEQVDGATWDATECR